MTTDTTTKEFLSLTLEQRTIIRIQEALASDWLPETKVHYIEGTIKLMNEVIRLKDTILSSEA